MEINWANFGFSRASALLPRLTLGKPNENADTLLKLFKSESDKGASVITTAELALTGYTCEDLFHSETLHQDAAIGLKKILDGSKGYPGIWIVGAPLRLIDGRLFNGAYVFSNGKVLGFVPKLFLPNMGEFYERRWFISGKSLHETIVHPVLGELFASPHQLFHSGPLRVGIEICQDLWAPVPPSSALAIKGANVIVNLSASNEVVGKADIRRRLVGSQSEKLHCAYLYTSSGLTESSKDTVFSGHTMAYELGSMLKESAPFEVGPETFTVDFDLERILNARSKDVCFLEAVENGSPEKVTIHSFPANTVPLTDLQESVQAYPFLAEIPDFEDVLQIQAYGLLRRAQSAKTKKLIIGISGGLDSTAALYVALRAKALSGNQLEVVGVTLPGPGTSNKTLNISRVLLESANVDLVIEVAIDEAVKQHLKDLGKSAKDRSIVYENAQARERTQILFDIANEHQGILVGTGDLSELALGWCTFNADHMAHYAVNSGIPKTVVKGLVGYWSEIAANRNLKVVLEKILELPISPELLPPDENGEIAQETEALIGSYDLHDFFIYHFLKHGFSKEKIRALAHVAFQDERDLASGVDKALDIFFGRFFSQQFKRTTLPPGPKVHSVSLSPRSDFRMPDELS
jgi:NAD+ synthase (glutamine-hydrolysing)